MSNADLPIGLVVGTMCHCGEPDECSDHWQFFTDVVKGSSGKHSVRSGRILSEKQMRAIAELVNETTAEGRDRP